MEKRIKALDKMRDMIRKKTNKTEFDLSYIKTMQFYKDLGKRAIDVLNDSNYYEICEQAENDKSFCHHDYTYHNIVIDEEANFNVIDFDYCKREVRVFDISNFMIKVLKRNDWNFEFAKEIINAYCSVSDLLPEEYRVLYSFLLFPQRFWRLANRYYYNEVNWGQNTFTKKIENLIEEQQEYMRFIDEFKQYYEQK